MTSLAAPTPAAPTPAGSRHRCGARLAAWLSGPPLVVIVCLVSELGAMILLGLVAWHDRRQTFDQARTLAINVSEVLAEHATRLLETSDYILRQAVRLAGPPGAPMPHTREDWVALSALRDAPSYVKAIWLGDAAGRAVLTTRRFPAPNLDASNRDFFRALRDGRRGLVLFSLDATASPREPMIVLSRPLAAEPSQFRGFATVAVAPNQFSDLYRQVSIGYAMTVSLVRPDLTVLVREPQLQPSPRPATVPTDWPELSRRLAAGVAGSFVGEPGPGTGQLAALPGTGRLVAFRRLEGFEAAVVVSVAMDDIKARWLARLWGYSMYGVATLTAVIGLGALAWHRARREETARAGLRQAHATLEQRVDERTAALSDTNAQLERALADKEFLVKEVHHRVKNNLQVIASLLRLQASRLDETARHACEDSLNRIHSMSLVHELLYRSPQPGRIDVNSYLHALCERLRASLAVAPRVRVVVKACDGTIDIDTASPLGLLIGELVCNALQHAFPGDRAGTVTVIFTADPAGRHTLVVADDGVGLPEGVGVGDPGLGQGLGLVLVRALAGQLRARLTLGRDGGATVTVELPAPSPSPAGAHPRATS